MRHSSQAEGGSSTPLAPSLARKPGLSMVDRSGPSSPGLLRSVLGRTGDEEVLERDDVAFHAGDLGDLGDAPRAVDEPLDVDEQVEAAGDLLADRLDRQLDAGHQHEHLEPVQRVARRVGVDRGQRAVVARVHRLEHVERLGAADLADDDPVGPHAECVADELADADLALSFDVRRTRLERDDVPLQQPQLGRVLDGDDPLGRRNEGGDGVQQRRLAGAGAARDEDVQLALDALARGTRPPAR